MKIVVDTNILFSFFWENSFTRKLLLTSPLELISPGYTLLEINKYKKDIISKTKINEKEFELFLNKLKDSVDFIKSKEYNFYIQEALDISPDKKDAEFLALCLLYKCNLWSNDLLLKKQNKVKVLSTEEIINLFS